MDALYVDRLKIVIALVKDVVALIRWMMWHLVGCDTWIACMWRLKGIGAFFNKRYGLVNGDLLHIILNY